MTWGHSRWRSSRVSDGAHSGVPVDGRAHLAELGDDAVVPVVDLAPVVDRRRMDARGAEHHDDATAALRLLLVVADVALGDAALLAEGGAVRRGDDAVLGGGVAERDRAEQPGKRGAHRPPWGARTWPP